MMYTSLLLYRTAKWEKASDEGNKSCVKLLWENTLLASVMFVITKQPNQLQKQKVTPVYSCHFLIKPKYEKNPL